MEGSKRNEEVENIAKEELKRNERNGEIEENGEENKGGGENESDEKGMRR